MKPKTLILTGFGINSDYELSECFKRAGSDAPLIHINDIISKKISIHDFDILAFPGGFSFGDHIGSGKVFANKFKFNLLEDIQKFTAAGKPVIGICNGFQVLVKMGLMPNISGSLDQEVTLTFNDSGKFEDRWVYLKINENNHSPWLKDINHIFLPVRHGEGKFYTDNQAIEKHILDHNLAALYYADSDYHPTDHYPDNPNGSWQNIAGLTDKSGLILGLMPHPEAFMIRENSPYWTRDKALGRLSDNPDGEGMQIFYNIVNYIK